MEIVFHLPAIADLLLENVLLVEEEDDGDRPQPPVVPDVLKQLQRLAESVLVEAKAKVNPIHPIENSLTLYTLQETA